MSLGQRLQDCRDKLRWTQLQVAAALKVPRELLSMWENNVRKPNLRQLEDLAQLFDTSATYLLTGKEKSAAQRPALLLRGLDDASPKTKLEVDHWLRFLDDWTSLLDPTELTSRAQPPKKLDRGPDFSDIRSASKLALEVREYYALGIYALPDLYTFLDEHRVLVFQGKLGSIGDGKDGISGVFCNHPKLGYAILINADTSKGRQMFTLAHEFAHALFHYGVKECIISRYGEGSQREQFADAFAAHFLVPAKGLTQIVAANEWAKNLDQYGVIILAHYFKVSYAFMLNRLAFERFITQEKKLTWQSYSPRSLAQHVGLDPDLFRSCAEEEPYLNRYPVSVLNRVRELIEEDELSVAQAADLLLLDQISIQRSLLQAPAHADENDRRELNEFAETYGSQRL